ncbi:MULTISPECIES: hypothetical protein [Okeania]|uniref:Glycosyltransferase RgtA/B/C/D-like domain-containing protein n=1 Tax=Okeania hirsuta TaxID=1458930 RepID=A0A3N6P7L1_9CYAN|nr:MULTISPECIES: hypothetical protein [Okeania]NET13677.1 hypothetical protein [Okeania sp. SIO1H6]NES78714.1 hypothetical protein [Okeania sp. SIO1H4]NET22946.1 hypothetical protein [Okeania sp. SIO1H5]NET80014.1 hypothetical protein [Okeania sp. SIO1F9]NET96365.1 hypothetical protein [Okeania sp. SIO1H2]
MQRTHSKLVLGINLCLAIIPAIVLGILILKYSLNVPIQDQWQIAAVFEKVNVGTLSFNDLMAQHNESRKFFPRLIFISLAFLTKWNIRYEILVIFLLACIVAVNIYLLNQLTINASPIKSLTIALVSNIFIFSAVQYENWLWGIQIVVFIPIVCITTSILIAYSQLNNTAKFLICMFLATISTFSYANGLLAWVIVLPVLALAKLKSCSDIRKNIKLYILWIIGFIANIALYFYDYQKPLSHPNPVESIQYPDQIFQYFLAFIGTALGIGSSIQPLNNSIILGSIIITLFICLSSYVLWQIKDYQIRSQSIGWIMLGSYTVISALVTSIGRVSFGIEQALSSRYTTFSTYLIISIIHLTIIVGEDWIKKEYLLINRSLFSKIICWFLGIITVLQIHNFTYSIEKMKSWRQNYLKYKGCLLLINFTHDNCQNLIDYYYFESHRQRARYLTEMGFLHPALIKTNRIQDLVDTNNEREVEGIFEKLEFIGENNLLGTGWAIFTDTGLPVDAIVLSYDNSQGESIVSAVADMTMPRPYLVKEFNSQKYFKSGWQKVLSTHKFPQGNINVKAWALDTDTAKFYQIPGTYVVNKNGENLTVLSGN